MKVSWAMLKDREGNEQGFGVWVELFPGDEIPAEGDEVMAVSKAGKESPATLFEKLWEGPSRDNPQHTMQKWSILGRDGSEPQRQFAPKSSRSPAKSAYQPKPSSKPTVKPKMGGTTSSMFERLEQQSDAMDDGEESPF